MKSIDALYVSDDIREEILGEGSAIKDSCVCKLKISSKEFLSRVNAKILIDESCVDSFESMSSSGYEHASRKIRLNNCVRS